MQELASDGETDAHALKPGFALLRFPQDLEAEFRAAHRAALRRWVRMSLFVALSTVLGFAVIDNSLLTGSRGTAAELVRFGLQLPCVLLMLLATSKRLYARWYYPGIEIAAPLFGVGTVLIASEAAPDHVALIGGRLVLAAFFFYFMIGLSFYAAVRSNLIMMAAFALAALADAVPTQVAIYQLFVLVCANIIGAAGAYALEHANRAAFLDRRRLAEAALHDGLTGLMNRGAFEEQMRVARERAARERRGLAVLMIDIDHFKAYNDRYGHQAGDACLRRVAAVVRRESRGQADPFVARYGGDELVAVLFDGDPAIGQALASAMCNAVAAERIPHAASPTMPYVTVSIGVATHDARGNAGLEATLRAADAALYAAKEQGRARYVSAVSAPAQAGDAESLLRTGS